MPAAKTRKPTVKAVPDSPAMPPPSGSISTAWKGTFQFALVTMPVRLGLVVNDNAKRSRFHQYHGEIDGKPCGARIRSPRVCEKGHGKDDLDGGGLPTSAVVKGIDQAGGGALIFTDDDMAQLPLTTAKTISVDTFAAEEQVPRLWYGKAYYMDPLEGGERVYALIRDSLAKSGRVGVVKITMSGKEQLAVVWPQGDYLVLSLLAWPEDVRRPALKFMRTEQPVSAKELDMAGSLIDAMTEDFDPSQLTDEYNHALDELIEAKLNGTAVSQPAAPAAAPAADDLADVLAMSLKQTGKAKPAARRQRKAS